MMNREEIYKFLISQLAKLGKRDNVFYYLTYVEFRNCENLKIKYTYDVPEVLPEDSLAVYAYTFDTVEFDIYTEKNYEYIATVDAGKPSITESPAQPCMLDSKILSTFLSKLDKTPTDAQPIMYDAWQVTMPDEEVPRLYKIVDVRAGKLVVEHFLKDDVLVCEWPFNVDPREYLKEDVYDTLVSKAAQDAYYDALYERAPFDSEYASVIVEKLVRYGIIPANKLDLDDAGKLVYKPIDVDFAENLTADELGRILTDLTDYYVARYGSAKQFIHARFTKKPVIVDGKMVREFDVKEFTNFLYFNDIKFTDEYFDMNRLLTDISAGIIADEYAKIGAPIRINANLMAFRQA